MSKFGEWMEQSGGQLLTMAGLGLLLTAAAVAVHLWVPGAATIEGQLQSVSAGCFGSMLTLLKMK